MTRLLSIALLPLCSLMLQPQALPSTVVLHEDCVTREIAPETEQKGLTQELFAAIEANDPDAVASVLMRGVALNVYDENGNVIVERLNAELITPLHAAAKLGNVTIFRMLCEVGLRGVGKGYISIGRFRYFPYWNDRMSIRKIRKLCSRTLECITDYLRGKPTQLIHVGFPIHRAVFYNHKDIVELLLEYGESASRGTFFGFTPLHTAAHYNYSEIAALLCIKGANCGAVEERFSQTPIDMARQYSSTETLKLLEAYKPMRSA